ncbi:MAG: 4-hydroxy-tetrahydrodipicolinate synthase [Acidaminococcaceae bacterium]
MKVPYFGRLLTAMVTPMQSDGSVDYDGAADFAEWLINNGSDGLVVAGTTGEAPTMTTEEKLELFRVIIKRINGRAPIVVGTGSNNTAASVEMTKLAATVGADGVLVVGPYYNKPTQEGFYQHFKAIATATTLPLIVYNVPGRTGSNILPSTVARLAKDFANIVAIKEAGGNVGQVAELYGMLPSTFTIYSGDDVLILPFMSVGATGLISVLSNLGGQLLQDLMQAYEEGRVKEARKLNQQMLPQAKAMFIVSNPIPVKEAVTLVTPCNAGPLRLPLTPMSVAESTQMQTVLRQTGLLK